MNNFIGEFLTIRGAFEAKVVWGAFAAVGIILGAAYMLWLYQRVFFGPVTNKANEGLKDLDAREAWQFAPLIFLIFWIGIYPKPLLSYIEPQTNVVVAQVQPDYFKTPQPRRSQATSRRALKRPEVANGMSVVRGFWFPLEPTAAQPDDEPGTRKTRNHKLYASN